VRYRILGPLELLKDDHWVAVGPAKWRMLLAVLLCEAGQIVTVDRLIDELWGERPPATVHKSVQAYVVRLRRLLDDGQGRTLVTVKSGYGTQGYQLLATPDDVDAGIFDALAVDGRRRIDRGEVESGAALLGEALSLWRGRPFADVPSTPAVAARIDRLDERRLEAAEAHIAANIRLGHHVEFVSELESLVAAHPLREGLSGQLMVALYNAGRQADALGVYSDLRVRLAQELGVDPSRAVQDIYQQVLAADPALLSRSEPSVPAAAEVPRQLPYSTAAFTGRAEELARIGALLTETTAHLPVVISAIDGTGGVGKSALAIRVAHELVDRFPDGQLYVDLCGATVGLSPLEPHEVLGRFLRALAGDEVRVPQNLEEASARYRSIVADRRLLVVLDNAATTDQVRPLLPAGSGCAVLVTSRRALAELDGARHLRLEMLSEDQSVTLLGRAIGPERIAADPDAAVEIARLCGGLPLALRIVAARLASRPDLPTSAMVDRLADERTRLDQLRAGDLAVRTGFEVSYQAISRGDPMAARAFRLMGSLNGVDVDALTVAAGLDESAAAAEVALEWLVDFRLAQASADGRCTLHDLLRLFARERAQNEESDSERAVLLERVLRYYLANAQRAVTLLDPLRQWPRHPVETSVTVSFDDRAAAEAWLEAERTNMVEAVVSGAEQSDHLARLAIGLSQTLHWFFVPHGYSSDQHVVQAAAISAARRLNDPVAEAWGLDNLGFVYEERSQYAEARRSFQAALAIWEQLGDRGGEQRCLCNIANVLVALDQDVEEAVELLNRQIGIAREIGNDIAEMIGVGTQGEAYRNLGRMDDALRSMRKCAELARELGDAKIEGSSLCNIGIIHLKQQNFAEARSCLEEGLELFAAVGYRSRQARYLTALSRVCRELGDLDAARRHAEEGRMFSRQDYAVVTSFGRPRAI
jgi:DNA-binding SARP family transcriptional activator/tetratricopeptide (TPR) repeat protein